MKEIMLQGWIVSPRKRAAAGPRLRSHSAAAASVFFMITIWDPSLVLPLRAM